MKDKTQIRLKDFDSVKAQKQLPEGYKATKSVPVSMNNNRYISIRMTGFNSKEEAIYFINKYGPLFPPNTFVLCESKNALIRFRYDIIAPIGILGIISPDDCKPYEIVVKDTDYDNQQPVVLYRSLGKEKHLENFFGKGEFLVSTFKRCRRADAIGDERSDEYELRSIVELTSGKMRAEMDIQIPDNLFTVCTSIEPIKDDPNVIKITDVKGFYTELTKTIIEEIGQPISEVLHGKCVYNDKVITKVDNSDIILKAKDAPFDAVKRVAILAENDIIMNKPCYFSHETEYRFAWKLLNPFAEECLIVHNKNLARYCERYPKAE